MDELHNTFMSLLVVMFYKNVLKSLHSSYLLRISRITILGFKISYENPNMFMYQFTKELAREGMRR